MFTGVIEETACILAISSKSLTVERSKAFGDVRVGSSVCVSGVCLTVVTLNDTEMHFDCTEETMHVSSLGRLRVGGIVNLERAMKVGSRLGGHIVQGHVEGIAEVLRRNDELLMLQLPMHLLPAVHSKGSIAIDGVSLTVASVDGNCITIALIPHTIEHTTLGTLQIGEEVNVETDVLTRVKEGKETKEVREAREARIGIVYADYYTEEIAPLVSSAQKALRDGGVPEESVTLHPVAGSFEIPLLGMKLAKSGKVDALIALGIIVEGETHHADLLAREVAHGIMDVQLQTGVPFAFEVLHVKSLAQVRKRHHRGAEAARACLQSLVELRCINSSE